MIDEGYIERNLGPKAESKEEVREKASRGVSSKNRSEASNRRNRSTDGKSEPLQPSSREEMNRWLNITLQVLSPHSRV